MQMLKHGRAGVPMEVMGLMLGRFVDEYTVQVIDVFAMPQSGTTVSVESVDHVFQTNMMEMLKQTGRYVCFAPGGPYHTELKDMIANCLFALFSVPCICVPCEDRRKLSAGTTPIPVSAVGYLVSISTRSK